MQPTTSAQRQAMMQRFEGRCLGCGYQLRGLTLWRCLECGCPFNPQGPRTFVGGGRTVRIRRVSAVALGLALAAILFVFVVRPRRASGPGPRIAITTATVNKTGAVATAIELYRAHLGHYPPKLTDLTERPRNPADAAKWLGPYIRPASALSDAWGRPLRYRAPGVHNPGIYDLWGIGPDGEDGTDDDIGNW